MGSARISRREANDRARDRHATDNQTDVRTMANAYCGQLTDGRKSKHFDEVMWMG